MSPSDLARPALLPLAPASKSSRGQLTRASARSTNISIACAAPLATALTSKGSNLAASSSLTTALAAESPSFAVGTEGGLDEKEAESEEVMEKEDETASLSRFVERVR